MPSYLSLQLRRFIINFDTFLCPKYWRRKVKISWTSIYLFSVLSCVDEEATFRDEDVRMGQRLARGGIERVQGELTGWWVGWTGRVRTLKLVFGSRPLDPPHASRAILTRNRAQGKKGWLDTDPEICAPDHPAVMRHLVVNRLASCVLGIFRLGRDGMEEWRDGTEQSRYSDVDCTWNEKISK